MKDMRDYLLSFKRIVLIILFVLLFFTIISTAHSPSSMKLKYNREAEILSVETTHQVSDTSTHYVENIKIVVNHEIRINQNYTSQPGSTFTYTYDNVLTNVGDKIEVVAICNIGGSISEQLMIGSEETSKTDDDSTPGFGIIAIFVSLVFILMILRKEYQ
jgi:desulfoferrodoxin (superoxide reductase-like protein)